MINEIKSLTPDSQSPENDFAGGTRLTAPFVGRESSGATKDSNSSSGRRCLEAVMWQIISKNEHTAPAGFHLSTALPCCCFPASRISLIVVDECVPAAWTEVMTILDE
jgi:hypothetical protein